MTRLTLEQTLRYDYPAPVRRLRHHLMVLPAARHGDQRRLAASVEVTGAKVAVVESIDAFGNVAMEVTAARVPAAVEFVVRVSVEREGGSGPSAEVGPMLDHTALTEPDAALAAAARALRVGRGDAWDLAARINGWVASTMRYRHDVTSVSTTAAEALSIGHGVCQDYAHVMLAVSRLCGLPARYVSGHLMGEGGSHAWVEVLLPSKSQPGVLEAVAYDPTNNRRAGETYLTIAVGRDYADVAPTHGSYSGSPGGGLTSWKSLEQERVALIPA